MTKGVALGRGAFGGMCRVPEITSSYKKNFIDKFLKKNI